jgi:glycosyltransferase involved in cell wall biosynthesis
MRQWADGPGGGAVALTAAVVSVRRMGSTAVTLIEGGIGHHSTRLTICTARLLRAAGASVEVLTWNPRSLATASRAVDHTVAVADAEAARARLAADPPEHVLATSDAAAIGAGLPGSALVAKPDLDAYASARGVPIPASMIFADAEGLRAAAASLPYPVVLKPEIGKPVIRAGSAADVEPFLEAIQPGVRIVVQPVLRGPVHAVAGVVRDGRVLAWVHQRPRRAWPDALGTSTLIVTTPPEPDLEAHAHALVRDTGHDGVFQAQFMEGLLLDLNLRLYGSVSLAAAAGVNLPALAVADHVPDGEPLRARPGVRYRWIEGDLRLAWERVRRRPGSAARVAWDLLPRPGTAHGDASTWGDLGPLVARVRRPRHRPGEGTTAGSASPAAGRREGGVVVGPGAPARGGQPTLIGNRLADEELRAHVPITFVNTTRSSTIAPGAISLGAIATAVRDVASVFRAGRSAAIVHLQLAPAPLLPRARACSLVVAARLAGAKTIVHAHSGRMHTVAASSAAYRSGLRTLVRLADRIVVVSDDGATAVRHAGGSPVVIPNAIAVPPGPPPPRGADRSIVFVGTVCERKGLDDLRVALLDLLATGDPARIPDRVTIIGDGRQEGPGVFERVRNAYGVSGLLDLVRFTGALPPEHVERELAGASIFCLPSHWEGLPISLLEAMAAGCAVVATEVGAIADAVAEAGVNVPAHDPARLAAALGDLLADPMERTRLGVAARERVRDAYALGSLRARLIELYAGLGYSR